MPLLDSETRRGSCFLPMNIQDENSIREWEREYTDSSSSKFISDSSKAGKMQFMGNKGINNKIND